MIGERGFAFHNITLRGVFEICHLDLIACSDDGLFADPGFPRKNADGTVTLKEFPPEKLNSCENRRVETQYIANQAVCVLDMLCKHSISGVRLVTKDVSERFVCPTTESRGCRNWRWQDCLVDNSLSQEMVNRCLSPAPRSVPVASGCPTTYSVEVPAEMGAQ